MTKGAKLLAAQFPSQVDLARRLGVHPSTLSLWITGKRKPTRVYAVKLEKRFAIPVEAWEQEL